MKVTNVSNFPVIYCVPNGSPDVDETLVGTVEKVSCKVLSYRTPGTRDEKLDVK